MSPSPISMRTRGKPKPYQESTRCRSEGKRRLYTRGPRRVTDARHQLRGTRSWCGCGGRGRRRASSQIQDACTGAWNSPRKRSTGDESRGSSMKRQRTSPTADLECKGSEVDTATEEAKGPMDNAKDGNKWDLCQKVDTRLEVAFRNPLPARQRNKFLDKYPPSYTNVAHIPLLEEAMREPTSASSPNTPPSSRSREPYWMRLTRSSHCTTF